MQQARLQALGVQYITAVTRIGNETRWIAPKLRKSAKRCNRQERRGRQKCA